MKGRGEMRCEGTVAEQARQHSGVVRVGGLTSCTVRGRETLLVAAAAACSGELVQAVQEWRGKNRA